MYFNKLDGKMNIKDQNGINVEIILGKSCV